MPPQLPAEPLRKLGKLVERSKRSSSVRFPVSFVRASIDGQDPPLAHLVRAGDVRLKLHLLLALVATRKPFEIDQPPTARWFAGALDLPDPDTKGARRVTDALTWLHDHDFIVRTQRPGKPPHIRLIHHGSLDAGGGRYVAVPISFWKEGWLLTLRGRAVGLYMVLKEATGGTRDLSATLSGSRKAQYGLSIDTWARATVDLEQAGLLTVEEVFATASSRDEWEPKRRRYRYTMSSDSILDLGPAFMP